jgi:hypothetical protein
MSGDCVALYLELKMGDISRDLAISRAQDLLGNEPVPEWVRDIAFLSNQEALAVCDILEGRLVEQGVLPDSKSWRLALKAAILHETEQLQRDPSETTTARMLARIEKLLRLAPSYEFNSVTIPIVEYPYPPSGVVSIVQLKEYIRQNIDRVLLL